MKLGVNLGLFPGETPLEQRLIAAADAGLDGVEINIDGRGEIGLQASETDIARVAARAGELGLEIPSVHCWLHWKHTLTHSDESERKRGVEVLSRSLEIGAALGANVLLVVPGVVTHDVSYTDAYQRAQEGVSQLAERAQSLGMKIGVENVWNKFLLSPLEMRRFIEEIGRPEVGAYFDVGNILAYGYPHHWIDVLAEHLFAVHVKDYRLDVPGMGGFVYLGEGDVPWDEVQAALHRVGYSGYVTAELPPYRYRGDHTVYDVASSMRRVLGMAPRNP